MSTLDAFMCDHRPTIEEMQRRKAAMERCRPARLPQALLMLDNDEFRDAYRQRYGLPPNARAWLEWYGAEKERARRNGR